MPAERRDGLYRIHVREAPGGGGFQQRFEYLVKGAAADVAAWLVIEAAAGDCVSDSREVGSVTYAVVLAAAPRALPSGLSGVSFEALRAGDNDGTLSWLWQLVE